MIVLCHVYFGLYIKDIYSSNFFIFVNVTYISWFLKSNSSFPYPLCFSLVLPPSLSLSLSLFDGQKNLALAMSSTEAELFVKIVKKFNVKYSELATCICPVLDLFFFFSFIYMYYEWTSTFFEFSFSRFDLSFIEHHR